MTTPSKVFKSALAVLLALAWAPGPTSGATPTPRIVALLPVTADSKPFLAQAATADGFDLAKHGYVEQEYLVKGTANVYDWAANGAVTVKTANAPYVTRILVRYPGDPARFSGSVIVELMHAGRRYDWAMMWGYSGDHFIEHGDAWVGITMPGAVAGLQQFDPKRYANLSYANPTPSAPCPGGAANTLSDSEEGLRWDAISQIGALLKSNDAARPLAGLKVEGVYMTMQSGDVMTYINAIHARATLDNGKPVYDGYLVKSPMGAARINRCAPAVDRNDARQKIHDLNVPVIGVLAQGDVIEALPLRRPDSDAIGDRYRSYEIAGASHIDAAPYRGLPSFEEQTRAGNAQGTPQWPFAQPCAPAIPLTELPLMSYAFNAAFDRLDLWARKGIVPPRGAPITLQNAGAAQASVALDAFGNGLGGVRSPYVDVPAATYFPSSPGPGNCREMGHKTDFDAMRIDALYGNRGTYVSKVEQSVDQLVKEGWFAASDGRKIKESAKAAGR